MLNQQLLPILGIGLGVLVGVGLLWGLTGRLIRPGLARTAVRLAATAGLVAGALLIAPRLLTTTTSAQSAATQVVQPSASAMVTKGTLSVTLGSSGQLEPVKSVALSFTQSAKVTEVLVKVGQAVKAGDVLARIDSTDTQSGLRTAQIALENARNSYDELVATPRAVDVAVDKAAVTAAQASIAAAAKPTDPNDVATAKINVEVAKNALWQAQLSRDETMKVGPEFRGGNGGAQANEISTTSGLKQDQTSIEIAGTNLQGTLNQKPDAGSLASASASLLQANVTLEDLLNGPSGDALRAAQIAVEDAALGVQSAEANVKRTELIAPFDGVVAAVNLQVGELPDTTSASTAAITLVDNSTFTIDLSVDETDIVDVAVGQTVNIAVDALPNAKLTGAITKLESEPSTDNNIVTYTAVVTVDPTNALIRPGMNATANIVLKQLDGVLLVPNSYITTNSLTQQASVITRGADGQYTPTTVKVGTRGASSSEILSGLDAGEAIYLLPQASASFAGAAAQGGLFGGPPGGGAGGPPSGGGGGGPP